jgi:hypothetical protein
VIYKKLENLQRAGKSSVHERPYQK